MKLRFRQNSLRLRVNQQEVDQLAQARPVHEVIEFPGSRLTYTLQSDQNAKAEATLQNNVISVSIPKAEVETWATGSEIGLYYRLPTGSGELKIAVEKDLECLDGPPDERDPHAFPREAGSAC